MRLSRRLFRNEALNVIINEKLQSQLPSSIISCTECISVDPQNHKEFQEITRKDSNKTIHYFFSVSILDDHRLLQQQNELLIFYDVH